MLPVSSVRSMLFRQPFKCLLYYNYSALCYLKKQINWLIVVVIIITGTVRGLAASEGWKNWWRGTGWWPSCHSSTWLPVRQPAQTSSAKPASHFTKRTWVTRVADRSSPAADVDSVWQRRKNPATAEQTTWHESLPSVHRKSKEICWCGRQSVSDCSSFPLRYEMLF